jgi:hypothetical protein
MFIRHQDTVKNYLLIDIVFFLDKRVYPKYSLSNEN